MKTKILNFVATVVLAIVFSFFLPWWSVMLAAFITAIVFSLKRAAVFFIPFLAIFVFWAIYSFLLANANDFTLAKKIAILLPLGGNPYILILVTGIVGGLAAGVAGVFGKQCRVLVKR
jgi:hypothetical protein